MSFSAVWNKSGVERVEVVCDGCGGAIAGAAVGVCVIPRPPSGVGAAAVGHYHQTTSCLIPGFLMQSLGGGGGLIQSLHEHLGALPGVPSAWPDGGTWIPFPYTPGPSAGPDAGPAGGPGNGTDDDLNDLDDDPADGATAPPGGPSPGEEDGRDSKLIALPRARRRGKDRRP